MNCERKCLAGLTVKQPFKEKTSEKQGSPKKCVKAGLHTCNTFIFSLTGQQYKKIPLFCPTVCVLSPKTRVFNSMNSKGLPLEQPAKFF